MASLSRRVVRRLAGPLHQAENPRFDLVEERLRLLDDKIDRLNHLLVTLDAAIQDNRGQILAARHEAHVLMVTDIDAANEATALLGRSLTDHRDLVEERLDRIEARLVELTAVFGTLVTRADEITDDAPVG